MLPGPGSWPRLLSAVATGTPGLVSVGAAAEAAILVVAAAWRGRCWHGCSSSGSPPWPVGYQVHPDGAGGRSCAGSRRPRPGESSLPRWGCRCWRGRVPAPSRRWPISGRDASTAVVSRLHHRLPLPPRSGAGRGWSIPRRPAPHAPATTADPVTSPTVLSSITIDWPARGRCRTSTGRPHRRPRRRRPTAPGSTSPPPADTSPPRHSDRPTQHRPTHVTHRHSTALTLRRRPEHPEPRAPLGTRHRATADRGHSIRPAGQRSPPEHRPPRANDSTGTAAATDRLGGDGDRSRQSPTAARQPPPMRIPLP